ncbi:MAG TPA: hypothetical protein VFD52_00205 [Clostridia bacterium]|nr:hypothetical protein [Clostridia bacterium]
MKRAELEVKLQGVEKAKDIIDFIMAENGKDITSLRADKEAAISSREEAIAKLAAFKEFTPEKVEAFNAFDPTEFEELKKYKADAETKAIVDKKTEAVLALLKENKASEKAAKLLIKGVDLNSVEFDESGKLKNGEEIIKPLVEDFAEYFTTETQGGAEAATPPQEKSEPADPFLAGFNSK